MCSSSWPNRADAACRASTLPGSTLPGYYAGGISLNFDPRPAAYAVIIRDGAILLAYWKQGGKEGWTLPAAAWTWPSTPSMAPPRNLRGNRVSRGGRGMLGIDVGHRPAEIRIDGGERDFQSLRLIYEATITGGELRHEVDGSTTHAEWIRWTTLPGSTRSRSSTPHSGSTASGP